MNIEPSKHPQWTPLLSDDYGFFDAVLRERSPKIVFDVGSNTGQHVTDWIKYGAKTVHCFEPVKEVFDVLQARFLGNRKVLVYPLGVSDKNETVENLSLFNVWTLATKGSRNDEAPDFVSQQPFSVNFIRLDDLGINPDFIKLDVDGYEFRALRGMERILKEVKPPIFFEFSHVPKFIFGENPADMCRFIYDCGYKAYSVAGWECQSPEQMMKYFPDGSSYDILLLSR